MLLRNEQISFSMKIEDFFEITLLCKFNTNNLPEFKKALCFLHFELILLVV